VRCDTDWEYIDKRKRGRIFFIDSCPCCGSKELQHWSGIVSPFIATYACGVKPHGCHMCECECCSFRFFDSRLTEAEGTNLYAEYRGDAYFKARHRYEFWYSRRVNDSIGTGAAGIAVRRQNLLKILAERAPLIKTVLDYGGDRGQFIPESLGTERYVYEISDAKTVEGVEHLNSVNGRQFDFVILAHVLEHCSEPRQILQLLKPLAHDRTLFYFEVPYERPSLRLAGKHGGQRLYLNALLRIPLLLTMVDLYSTVARIKFGLVPPLGLQKCSEHLNFFNEPSLCALLESDGFEVLESGTAVVGSNGPLGTILYGLARKAGS
jgi:Methyltransferase domain